jgi:hypothetical protein
VYKNNPEIKIKYKKEITFRKKTENSYIKAGFTFEESRIIAWDLFFKSLEREKEINIKIDLNEEEN